MAPIQRKRNPLQSYSDADCRLILKALLKEEPSLAERLDELVRSTLKSPIRSKVSDEVFASLEAGRTEDIWERSGSTSDGYVSPDEAAEEKVREIMEPYEAQLNQYLKVGLWSDAQEYAFGVLEGLYRFSLESESLFHQWVGDSPSFCFQDIVQQFRKVCSSEEALEMWEEAGQDEFAQWWPKKPRRATKRKG